MPKNTDKIKRGYKSIDGCEFCYKHEFYKLPDRLDMVHEYARIFDSFMYSDSLIISLREENKRLKCENEFMLKLIEKNLNND